MTRVLIVDDKAENLYLLRALLGGLGYEVDEARHSAEALAKACMAPPQLIISDLLMPVMDGYTLLRHWKADERLKQIPFVVYTATYTEPKDERLALDLGADAFIIKPAEPEPFIARIEEVLAKEQREELLPARAPKGEEEVLLKEYSEVLVRKPEKKALQLEQANRALEQDIAERKQAEEALREREQQLRLFVEHSPAAIAMFDRDMRYLVASRRWLSDYRLDDQEVIGRSHYDVFPDIPDRWKQIHRRCLGGAIEKSDEDPFLRADGTTDWVRWEIRPWQTAHGGVGGLILFSEVITERKRAEEERERLQAALRRGELMAAMGALVAGVAHEVRNPLFGMSATLDAFEARFGTQEGYQQYLTVLRGEVNRLTDLMRDLLEYGKPISLALAPEAIGEVIAEAVAACASLADAAGVQLVVERTAAAAVVVDRDRVRQVLQNLLQNAIQHSPRGGVVTVTAVETPHDGRAWIECAIQDSGPGFRAEDLPQIFEPFFSRRKGGTGLGLSVVKRVVEEHHGEVHAANRPEGGAIVTVRLPAAE